jgi:integrase
MATDGKRKTIRLGKVNQKAAEAIKTKVEAIIAGDLARISLDDETAKWLREIPDQLAKKLAAVNLVPFRVKVNLSKAFLGCVLDDYLAFRSDVKPNTMRNFKACRDRLVEFFGKDRHLESIAPGDADAWVAWMIQKKYAKGTVGVSVKRAKQFFRAAMRRRLITESPFADVKAPSQVNKARQFFVSRDISTAVLEACPDTEWRLIFALARYGGLRVPSELLQLRWTEVDWERGRFLVHAPKTEHHEDGGERWVPLYPELRIIMEDAFDQAPEGSINVIHRHRGDNANLRTHLIRIIHKAGRKPWPRLFQNLRSSRETELALDFPIHAVCSWIGHSVNVAEKHYLQVTEDLYLRAAKSGALNSQNALQKPVQQSAACSGRLSQKGGESVVENELMREDAICCKSLQHNGLPPVGLEAIFPILD